MNSWWDMPACQQSKKISPAAQWPHALGVGDDRIYVDHGLIGTKRDRPGLTLTLALAAPRAGDTFVVTKPDRLAHSLPDARDLLESLRSATSS
jgi:DNA invertase Pin-like site-specific DNA recombinase